jgi:hypothetical protein
MLNPYLENSVVYNVDDVKYERLKGGGGGVNENKQFSYLWQITAVAAINLSVSHMKPSQSSSVLEFVNERISFSM